MGVGVTWHRAIRRTDFLRIIFEFQIILDMFRREIVTDNYRDTCQQIIRYEIF